MDTPSFSGQKLSGTPFFENATGTPTSKVFSSPTQSSTVDSRLNVAQLRGLIKSSIANAEDHSALFFADKLVTVTNAPDDMHLYAQCLFRAGQYSRALFHLEQRGLLGEDQIPFRLMAARCLAKLNNWDDCLSVVEGTIGSSVDAALRVAKAFSSRQSPAWVPGTSIHEVASLCCVRADVLVEMENRARAIEWYTAALQIDCHCVTAFDKLMNQHLLTLPEERQLLSLLHFPPEAQWLKLFYATRLNKYSKRTPMALLQDPGQAAASSEPTILNERTPNEVGNEGVESLFHRLENDYGLQNNAELRACKAERYYYGNDCARAYSTAMTVKDLDPYVPRSLPIYISSLVDLRRKAELFKLAHSMVHEQPQNPESWFAVGCYYYLIGKNGQAKRYFEKATTMDTNFACGWIGYGNAFAAQDESDQAMTAYRSASRLFYGCHLPALYIGMEYIRTNNMSLAEKFLQQAEAICPADPLVLNELGVVAYTKNNFDTARKFFEAALSLCSSYPDGLLRAWEPTITNLGHVYRQQGEFELAIRTYRRARDLCPMNATVHASLAFATHLAGRRLEAIELYHASLALKPTFAFAEDMLNLALLEVAEQDFQDDHIGTATELHGSAASPSSTGSGEMAQHAGINGSGASFMEGTSSVIGSISFDTDHKSGADRLATPREDGMSGDDSSMDLDVSM